MNLQQALDNVYDVFSAVRRPIAIDACSCCSDQAQICSLLTVPLREITAEQLSDYAASVFLTAGAEQDFRYLLPRILDILVHDRWWYPDPEVALGKLTLANWSVWPAREREAIRALLEAAFDDLLSRPEDAASDVDGWICGLGRAGVELAPYLRKLEDPGAESILIEFFERNAAHVRKGKLENAFWEDYPERMAPVVEWFGSPGVQQIIGRHYGWA